MVLYRVPPYSVVGDVKYLYTIFGYVLISILFLVIVYLKGLDSLEYFRLPRKGAASMTAMVIAAMYVSPQFFGGRNEMQPLKLAIPGIIFLLGIGISEEIFSRGLTFGMLRHYGERKAIIVSSAIFGLLHINVYVGQYWDLWDAYHHVVSSACWGFLACSIMIATRSIWFTALFHACVDTHIVFGKEIDYSDAGAMPVYTLWDNLITPWSELIIYVPLALLILRVNRGGWPKWIEKIALRWKLVVPSSI
jgi:membrane protease YdiL (CAAX protease family)